MAFLGNGYGFRLRSGTVVVRILPWVSIFALVVLLVVGPRVFRVQRLSCTEVCFKILQV